MSGDPFGPLMFAVLFLLIFVGYPVAFALGGTAMLFAGVGILAGEFTGSLLEALPVRLFGVMSNQVLLAVPFFIHMGTMLERSRLAEDLLRTIGLLFGPRPGGLALAVVLVGTLLAAATGVVGASVVAMGMISLPIMLRYGYAPTLATGVICASGTLGQIVPPSVVLVVLADQLDASIADLFVGSLFPGLILAGLFALYVSVLAWRRPELAPAIPRSERERIPHLGLEVVKVMIPPLALIVIVLGSIFRAVATPTEAGALGAVGAMVLAALRGRLTWKAVREASAETMRLTSMVAFLLIGSSAFTLVFRGLHGGEWIQELLTNLPGGRVGLLVIVNLAVFLLGFFIDFFEIAFILLPLVAPAAAALGIVGHEMVWFGVMIAMNLQTSFLTPPFGFSLFYLRGVAPESISTGQIYRGALPFIAIQVVGLALVVVFPELVTGLLE